MKQSEKDQHALEKVLSAVEAADSSTLKEALPAAQRALSSGAPVRGASVLPLQAAAAKGYIDIVTMLVDAGAPLEATDGKGMTALQVRIVTFLPCLRLSNS